MSGTGGTVYFAFNYGMAADGVTSTLKLGNVNIYTSVTKQYGTTLGTLPSATRVGYEFLGWYTSPSAGVQISSTTNVPASNTTYYARWRSVSYTLLLDGNSGTISGGVSLTNLVKNGSFENGSTDWSLSGASVTTAQKYSGSSSLQLNPSVTAYPTQTLRRVAPTDNHYYYGRTMFMSPSGFSANDSRFEWFYNDTTDGHMVFATKSASTSGNWNMLSSIIKVSGTTYLSNSWYLRNFTVNGTATSYLDDVMIFDVTSAFNSSIPDKKMLDKINFFEESTSVLVQKVSYNGKYDTLPTPTRSNYTFDGWYTSPTGGTKIESGSIVNIASDHALYAHWIPIFSIDTNPVINGSIYNSGAAGFTYNVKVNGVQVATNVQDYWATVPYGGTLELIPNGVTGYNAYSFSKVIYDSSAVSGPTWNGITYYIAYDGNMASYGSTATTTCTYGVNCNLTANGFSRTDYNFAGWAINNPNAAATYSNQQTVSNLTTTNGATIMMYAKWVGVWKSYTATFNYVIDANHNFSLIGNSATYTTSCNFQVPNNSCSAPTPGLAFGSSTTSGNMLDLFNITWGGVAYLSNAVTLTGNTTLTLVVSSKYANNGSVLKGGKNNAWVRKGAAVNGTLSNDQKYGYIRSGYKAYWADGDYRIGTTNHLVWVKGYGYGLRCKKVGGASNSSCNSKACDSTSCRVPSGSTNGWISLQSLRW